MNTAFDELFENAFKTGDYSKLKEMIEKYERESVFLYPTEKKAIEIFNYFINLNKKIDLEFFSGKDEYRFKDAILAGNFKKIKSYLKKYEDFQSFEWVKEGLVEKVAHALQNGLNPNKKTGDNKSLLVVASTFGQTEIVAMLIKKGAKINPSFFERDKESPALRAAVYHNHTETALLLLEHGAEIMNNLGTSEFLSISVRNKNEILAKRILNIAQEKNKDSTWGKEMFWAGNSSLSYAIVHQDEKMVKLLLDAGATFQPNKYSYPLKEALLTCNKNIIDMVYEKATQEERAIMASISIQELHPFAMFHLYQKKCPIFSKNLNMFTIEEILGCTFLQRDKNAFNYIMKTLSEDEKSKIDWKKAKSSINNDLPLVVRNMITRTFKEVFQEEQKCQEITRKPAYSNQQPFYFSISTNTEATSDNLTITFPTLISHQNTNIKPKDEGRGARSE